MARQPRPRHFIAAAAVGVAGFLATTPADAGAALFFQKGSSTKVERHHVTVALTAKGTVTWDVADISGGATADVGVIVAVKAGGRIEVSARVWIDVIEAATRVNLSTLPANLCAPIAPSTSSSSSSGSTGGVKASGSGEATSSSGCGGNSSAEADGGGGCYSNSSSNNSGCSGGGCSGGGGGCGGCGSCGPSEEGHPGCSAFSMTTANGGCGPIDKNSSSSGGGSSSGSSGNPGPFDGSVDNTPRVGPYEVFRVRAGDGSAAAWLDTNGYEPGASFNEAATAVEKDGYELYAVRARPPTSASVIQSLRVITTSPAPAFPLRMLRMGSNPGLTTPLTMVLVADTPQKLADTTVLRIDEGRLASNRGSFNYESLLSAALAGEPAGTDGGAPTDSGGGGGDAGASSTTRWVVESSRSLTNRLTPTTSKEGGSSGSSGTSGTGGGSTEPTIADSYRLKCEDETIKHVVCSEPVDGGGENDAGAVDAGGDAASDGGGASDSGSDAGDDDASTGFDAGTGCSEISRLRCDDLDLAIAPGSTAFAVRFRALIGGDPALVADLSFTASASTDVLPTGRYTVRDDGVPGLCDPPAGSSSSSSSSSSSGGNQQDDDGSGTCKQTPTRFHVNFGPIVTLLVAARVVLAIMKRARRRR